MLTMRISTTLFAAALVLAASGASSQTMYRCGNVYQASPCPGGVPVDAKSVPKPPADAPKAGATGAPGTANVPPDKAAAERAAAIKKAECDPLKAQHEYVSGLVSRGGGGPQVAAYGEQKKRLEGQIKAKACDQDPKDAARKK
jgi:hypothetical protein